MQKKQPEKKVNEKKVEPIKPSKSIEQSIKDGDFLELSEFNTLALLDFSARIGFQPSFVANRILHLWFEKTFSDDSDKKYLVSKIGEILKSSTI